MVDKNAHYLMFKGGVFYFTRHVPNDLQRHYETRRIVICLNTRNHASLSKISNEWKNRKLITSSELDLMDNCTSEVERLLNEPEQWSMNWLSEFCGKDDLRRVTVLLWAEQCNKEYVTMVKSMSKWIDY